MSNKKLLTLLQMVQDIENALPSDPADESSVTGAISALDTVVDTYHAVPTADLATNTQIKHVIGNKSDTTGGTSLVSLVKTVSTAVTGVSNVLATLVGESAVVKEWTLDLSQVAGNYDITTASGDSLVESFAIYVATAAATLDSVKIYTDDTTVFELMTIVEGATANLLEGAQIHTANMNKPFRMTALKKIKYTLAGTTGTGSIKLVLKYYPISASANLP